MCQLFICMNKCFVAPFPSDIWRSIAINRLKGRRSLCVVLIAGKISPCIIFTFSFGNPTKEKIFEAGQFRICDQLSPSHPAWNWFFNPLSSGKWLRFYKIWKQREMSWLAWSFCLCLYAVIIKSNYNCDGIHTNGHSGRSHIDLISPKVERFRTAFHTKKASNKTIFFRGRFYPSLSEIHSPLSPYDMGL